MTALTLSQLRAAFEKPETFTKLPNNYYPFWNMKVGESVTIRFLPDKNPDNSLGFLVEKKAHKLHINGKERKVPCLDMYGEKCPICQVSRDYYKVDDKVNGKKYYRTMQYVAQAILVDNPLPVEEGEDDPVGKVRLFALGPQIYKIIKEAFGSGDLIEAPYDYANGTDFIIKKDKLGDHANYSLSKFARRERAVDEDTIASIQLIDLSTILPKNLGIEKVSAMLEADLNGEAYDDDHHSSNEEGEEDTTPKVTSVAAPKVAKESTPEVNSNEDSGEDVLAKLRADLAARRK